MTDAAVPSARTRALTGGAYDTVICVAPDVMRHRIDADPGRPDTWAGRMPTVDGRDQRVHRVQTPASAGPPLAGEDAR